MRKLREVYYLQAKIVNFKSNIGILKKLKKIKIFLINPLIFFWQCCIIGLQLLNSIQFQNNDRYIYIYIYIGVYITIKFITVSRLAFLLFIRDEHFILSFFLFFYGFFYVLFYINFSFQVDFYAEQHANFSESKARDARHEIKSGSEYATGF